MPSQRCHQINSTYMEHNQDTNIAEGIKITSGDNPYAPSIIQYLSGIMDGANLNNFKSVLNHLEEAFYASGEIRYGSKPEVEHIAHVRNIISAYMNEGRPIPILVPFGSIKARFNASLDIAELGAINQMMALQKRVIKFYAPGVQMVVRMEDTSGYELFKLEDKDGDVAKHTQRYIDDFKSLVSILGASAYIHVLFESEMHGAHAFADTVSHLVPLFNAYLTATDENLIIDVMPEATIRHFPEFKALAEQGWNGIIPAAQRKHYYTSYAKLYDGDKDLMRMRLAMYFAGSLARHKLHMTGKNELWDKGFVQLAFVGPVPGIPESYNKNYVYYRTIPESNCRSHMPPWRAKGYLRINDLADKTTVCPKLATFWEAKDYNTMDITITRGEQSVTISADYVLETNKPTI